MARISLLIRAAMHFFMLLFMFRRFGRLSGSSALPFPAAPELLFQAPRFLQQLNDRQMLGTGALALPAPDAVTRLAPALGDNIVFPHGAETGAAR